MTIADNWPVLIPIALVVAVCVIEILDRAGWIDRWGAAINAFVDRIAARIAPKDKA